MIYSNRQVFEVGTEVIRRFELIGWWAFGHGNCWDWSRCIHGFDGFELITVFCSDALPFESARDHTIILLEGDIVLDDNGFSCRQINLVRR